MIHSNPDITCVVIQYMCYLKPALWLPQGKTLINLTIFGWKSNPVHYVKPITQLLC